MVKSMTGYGRCENEAEGRKFSVEIKSVNHRYNDISIRLPRTMNYLEDKIRKTLMKKIMRERRTYILILNRLQTTTLI